MEILPVWQLAALAAALALGAGIGAALYQRLCTRRMLMRLDQMLDAALAGTFRPADYDESALSLVEARLGQYLAAGQTAARSLNAEKQKISELISDVSHQTKTPVANILLYGQLLAEKPLPPDSARCVAELNAQAEKLRFLLDALVTASRLETGIVKLEPAPGPVGPMLERVCAAALPAARGKGLALTLAPLPPAGQASALFDEKWTAEALGNLLDNAVKYTDQGGVTVRVQPYELFCRIDIADTGAGIPEEEQAKIFGRFYRGAALHRREGTGLGLYLARQIVAGQGGYIKVRSAPGRGSVFSVFLPRGA